MARVDLRGRPIAITGASSGIGAATAIECARVGMPVALLARRADRLEEVASRVRALGAGAVCVPGSVEHPEDCARLIEACVESFGSVYAVFANAGIGHEGAASSMSDEELRRVFEVNFFGSIHAVRPAIERMKAAGEGHVLFCSSCLSKVAVPYHAAYCSTKTCQEVFARAMRTELRPHNIRVSSVHPIGTRTELFDRIDEGSTRGSRLGRGPDAFVQPPERVGRAVVRRLRRPGRTGGEVWTSAIGHWVHIGAHAAPWLSERILATIVGRRLRRKYGDDQSTGPRSTTQ